jgi:hypothetical protein
MENIILQMKDDIRANKFEIHKTCYKNNSRLSIIKRIRNRHLGLNKNNMCLGCNLSIYLSHLFRMKLINKYYVVIFEPMQQEDKHNFKLLLDNVLKDLHVMCKKLKQYSIELEMVRTKFAVIYFLQKKFVKIKLKKNDKSSSIFISY